MGVGGLKDGRSLNGVKEDEDEGLGRFGDF